MKRYRLGLASLAVGIVSLALAIIPGLVVDEPAPLLAALARKADGAGEQRDGGLHVRFKGFALNIGKVKKPDRELADEVRARARRAQTLKWLTVSAVAFALIGLAVAPFAYVRERRAPLPLAGAGCCCVAITWQYILVGVLVGASAAVFLVVLALLGGLLDGVG